MIMNYLRDVSHGLEVLEGEGVLQDVQVLLNSGVSLTAPYLD